MCVHGFMAHLGQDRRMRIVRIERMRVREGERKVEGEKGKGEKEGKKRGRERGQEEGECNRFRSPHLLHITDV